MAVWQCVECTARYAVGAPKCPQCGSVVRTEDTSEPEPAPLTVVCRAKACEAHGVRRQVWPRQAAPGVVERPTLHCSACGHPMVETNESEESSMPKVTVHTGASVEVPGPEGDGTTTMWVGEHGPETLEPNVDSPTETGSGPAGENANSDGGEQPSPGSSSETSNEKPSSGHETSEAGTRSHARTTGSRSGKGRTGSSSARATDGGRTARTSETGDATEDKKED